jgi:hypothetical protein
MAEQESLVLLARRDVLESRLVQRLRDAWWKVACRLAPQVVLAQRVESLKALLTLLQAQTDESESPQEHSLRGQRASLLAAPLLVQELAPWPQLEQEPQAPPVRLALQPVQREQRPHSVSLQLERRSLAEAPQVRQVSSARPSRLLLLLLFPSWQPLPRELLLRPLLESFCALSRPRPQGLSSNASSFP